MLLGVFGSRTTVNGVSLVEHAPRSGTLWSGATSARVRPWPHSSHRAFLLISGSHGPDLQLPDTTVLSGWIHMLTDWGYRSVRTSALSPSAAEPLQQLGFTVSQDLALLRLWNNYTGHQTRNSSIRSLRNLPFLHRPRKKAMESILAVDRVAFEGEWSLDVHTLREALTATRKSCIFVSHTLDQVTGFVLVGATDSHGFVQRLAVHPDFQRSGIATELIGQAMQWTNSHGCTSTVVNTDVDNNAALTLYKGFGFEQLDYGLAVLERALP